MKKFGAVITAGLAFNLAACNTFETGAELSRDWLTVVNDYRAQSGLDLVTHNTDLDAGAVAHSCYMLNAGTTHYEDPANPGYTEIGYNAGTKGDVAVSSDADATAESFIDLWMTGPFHAIGLLRPNLKETAFGICANKGGATEWHSGATLDVISGLDLQSVQTEPVLFPGNRATTDLNEFVAENPNPIEMCGWQGKTGLPLIAMFPDKVTSAEARLSGPSGDMEVCVLHPGMELGDPTANAVIDFNNAVVVIPRLPLENGAYHSVVATEGQSADWTFRVNT